MDEETANSSPSRGNSVVATLIGFVIIIIIFLVIAALVATLMVLKFNSDNYYPIPLNATEHVEFRFSPGKNNFWTKSK